MGERASVPGQWRLPLDSCQPLVQTARDHRHAIAGHNKPPPPVNEGVAGLFPKAALSSRSRGKTPDPCRRRKRQATDVSRVMIMPSRGGSTLTIAERRIVPSVYPHALIACIRDGRSPVDSELKQIAGKTWEEGARFLDETTPAMTSRLVLRALSQQTGAQGLER